MTQGRGIYQGDKDPYFSKTVNDGQAAARAHYASAVWSVSKDSNGDELSQRCNCCCEVTKQLQSGREVLAKYSYRKFYLRVVLSLKQKSQKETAETHPWGGEKYEGLLVQIFSLSLFLTPTLTSPTFSIYYHRKLLQMLWPSIVHCRFYSTDHTISEDIINPAFNAHNRQRK